MNHSILQEIIILLAISVLAMIILRRFHFPPILAYLLVGIVAGPHAFGLIEDTEDTRFLAEFGVVFLMFTIGLEFSLAKMMTLRREVFGLGGLQVIFTALIVTFIAQQVGLSWNAAFVVGGVIALSSTAIVIKQLNEQLEMNSRHGHLSLSILIFQDLAVIPALILIPTLAGDGQMNVWGALGWASLKGVGVIAIMIAVGHYILRPLFHELARAHMAEMFTLSVLLFSLAAAWATHAAGLSLALGAFIAGMMLAETEFRHQVETEIRPFRDVLLGLFFITVGMLLNISALLPVLHWVLLLTLTLMLGKVLLITLLGVLFRIPSPVAMRTGIVLSQGGEFGFAILTLSLSAGLLTLDESQLVLAAVIISMLFAPLMIRYNGTLAKWLFKQSYGQDRASVESDIKTASGSLNNHVVICGYSRIGQNVGRFVEDENMQYIALDLDAVRVHDAHDAGESVFYGDATHREILEAAGIERARAVVTCIRNDDVSLKIIHNVRLINPDVPILVRTKDDIHLDKLLQAGATEVVPENVEAGLVLSSHLLFLLDIPMSRIARKINQIRKDRYQLLRGFFHGTSDELNETPYSFRERLHAVTLPPGAYAVGKTIDEINFAQANIVITALRRDGIRGPQPSPQMQLRAHDSLVLYGTPEDLQHAENVLLRG